MSDLSVTYSIHDRGVIRLMERLEKAGIQRVAEDRTVLEMPVPSFKFSPVRRRDPSVGQFPRDLLLKYSAAGLMSVKLYESSTDLTSIDRAIPTAVEATRASGVSAFVQLLPTDSLRRLVHTHPANLDVLRKACQDAKGKDAAVSILADEAALFDCRLQEAIHNFQPVVALPDGDRDD